MGDDGRTGAALEIERVDVQLRVEDLVEREVVCGTVRAKQASEAIKLLSLHLPIPALRFLKRVRKAEASEVPAEAAAEAGGKGGGFVVAMLGPRATLDGLAPGARAEIEGMCSSTFTRRVPGMPPNTMEQFYAWSKLWPLNFRPPVGGMKAVAGFTPDEMTGMKGHMHAAIVLANRGEEAGGGRAGAVVVDPATGTIITEAYDQSASAPYCAPPSHDGDSGLPEAGRHPLRHAAMCAIQQVAALHRERDGITIGPSSDATQRADGNASSNRKPAETLVIDLDQNEPGGGALVGEGGGAEGRDGQYLCTGYDVYLTCEPCPMCAMALVHARVRRVIFAVSNPAAGALGSRWAVHLQASLNHHYEVYRGLLASECPQFPPAP
ncbi:cytidine deaminase-like protein [Baffinella frigidus]|nr:cytidine deaminase-like protein [Cryptophyta sp. CCMP2293]